ncbi:hypothetical protein MKY82_08450 [Paenibacillus sp. FSL W7-1279]|uniref:hypothetical protein n=1 Tax=Paenibacillus sp. FSL W7-1279 TaxID=2921697 RepID=UPI0030DAD2E8
MMMLTMETKQKVNFLICELSTQLYEQVKKGVVCSEEIVVLARLVEVMTPIDATDSGTPVVGFHTGNQTADDETS